MMALLPVAELTSRQRRNGIAALMTSTFFSWAGFFLVVSLMAVNSVRPSRLGGVIFDIGQHDDLSRLPWTVFAGVALLSAAGHFLDREMFA
jgi:hypothetical protein